MAAPKIEAKIFTAIVLDFETGGLDCTRCACTQIAMQAVRLDTLEVTDRYVKYIAPYDKQELGGGVKRKILRSRRELEQAQAGERMDYEQVALNYSAITMDMLENTGVDIREAAADIIEFAKRNTLTKGHQCKPVLIGQNIPFDTGFLQQMMNYAGLVKEFEKVFAGDRDFYGNFQPRHIDIIDLGRLAFAGDPDVTSYKLELIARRLGIELDDAHDADADVTATLNIALTYSGRLRSDGPTGAAVQQKEKSRKHFKI